MRVLGLLFMSLLVFGSFTTNKNEYILLHSKVFSVKGSTSIGNYDCDYRLETQDTLFLNHKKGIHYKVPVKEFGCGNFLLTRDFRKTLREKEYPFVHIHVSEVKKSGNAYHYNLRIDLAGKIRNFQNLKFNAEKNGLRGNVQLKFSDFNLTPPQKLGGAIKVKEEINLSIWLKTS